MTRTPPSETSDPDATTRRARLESRRRQRTRLIVVAVIIAVAGIGGAVAYALNGSGTDAHAASSDPPPATFGAEGTLVPGAVTKATVRKLDHAHPLKLWIGGDSLAGSFGPALGDRVGATGVVSTVIDYKTSSGLYSNDIRNWYQRAGEQMKSVNPDAVVFIIGTNDASIVNTVDSNNDLVPDWEASYKLKIDRMMDLLVGPTHRTVFWLGPPTLGASDLDKGGKALGELMQKEAAKHAPDVVYLDTYKLFSSIDGGYSRTILDENGNTITARIPDGVHFTADGADYLARAVFTLIDARWRLTKQADLLHPIGWTNAPGSGEVVPGFSSKPRSRYRSGSGGSSNNNTSGNSQPSDTTVSPPTSASGNVSGTTGPTTPSATVSPTTGPHATSPPSTNATQTVTSVKTP